MEQKKKEKRPENKIKWKKFEAALRLSLTFSSFMKKVVLGSILSLSVEVKEFIVIYYITVLYDDCEGFIILFFNNSSTFFVISSLWTEGNLYCLEKIRESSIVGIECCKTLVAPSGSPGIWNLSALLLINLSTCSYSS